METEPIVYVVDDDIHVLASVQAILAGKNLKVICYTCAEDLLRNVSLASIGVVVTDLQMPGMTGIELQMKLQELGSLLSVIVVTGFADVRSAVQIMEIGAVTLLEKPYQPAALVDAVKRGVALSIERNREIGESRRASALIARLNEEELDVMKHAIKGLPNKAIGQVLTMSLRTVDRRRQSALQKLEIPSVAEFAALLIAAGKHQNRSPDSPSP